MVKKTIKPLSEFDLALGLPLDLESKELIALCSPLTIDRSCPIQIKFDFLRLNIQIKKHHMSNGDSGCKVDKCPHLDRPHYSKGMCIKCYKKFGRTKLATKCEHTERSQYAKGQC